ncbi:hypothetical protein E9993_14290 [Labilibacter sediminis]|nr:hypothetical protein E9993_14290 [Labilibacter sediminis]
MRLKVLLGLVFVILTMDLFSQFSASVLSEYQNGKLPKDTTENFNSIYSRVLINYQMGNFKVGTGIQLYQTPYSERNYVHLSAGSINYQSEKVELTLGNYSQVLGNGILLRNYQIPGAIVEDKGFRTKQYFYTDMLGAQVAFHMDKLDVKALWGYALNNLNPPILDWELRRYDEVIGTEVSYRFKKQVLGASGIRLHNELETSYYGMLSLSGDITEFLSYYSGYARYLSGEGKETKERDAYALYGNIVLTLPSFGISAEYKNYQNFLIGTGINEPPALVKEHYYKLLNRSTHVLQPTNESGVQLEAYYQMNLFSSIVANYTLAVNDFGIKYRYQEWFLEYSGNVFNDTDLKLFVDYADDEFKSEYNRVSYGVNLDVPLVNHFGFLIEAEGQGFERLDSYVSNYYLNFTLRRKSKWFWGTQLEVSNDPFITEDKKIWPSVLIKYKYNSNHSLQLFAGERRGGPACNAGICYEVLDFSGVELRWMARF